MASTKANKLIPSIKKDLKSFMLEEKGGASKQALISFGALLASLQISNILSETVFGATISAKHDHCDIPDGTHLSSAGTKHLSADGVPSTHCNRGTDHGSSHGNIHCNGEATCGHHNGVYLNYG